MHEFSPMEPDNLSCTECGKGRYHENHRTPQNIAYQKIMGMVGGMIDVGDVRRREIRDVLNELYDAAEEAGRDGAEKGSVIRMDGRMLRTQCGHSYVTCHTDKCFRRADGQR